VAAQTSPVHKPGKRHRKQEADEHAHPGEKPHLLLMRGEFRLFPACVSVWHDFSFIHDATAHPPSGLHPMKVLNRQDTKEKTSPEFRARLGHIRRFEKLFSRDYSSHFAAG
jgi:hypothetical protein